MAINKKLIHFDMTKQLFMSNANGLNNLTKPTNGIVGNIPYYSVVFLKDGYIWTHGHFINGTGIADSVSSNATISWYKITDKPSTFIPSAHTQSYTTLTGSGTTANQAIVSSGTANGWTLKTLGSRAFDSTSYLPLSGGTMNAGAMIVWQDWGQWGASSPTYPKANGGLQWSGTSDWIKLFAEETAPDDLRLILQCGDDTSPQFNIRNYEGITTVSLHSNGTITGTSIVNSGSNNNYVLLGGGGTKALSDFLYKSGGTLTGNLILKGNTTDNMTYSGNVHPCIRFDNSDSSQNVSLIFTDLDSYRSPAGLKLVGNQGREWFEAPVIYQNGTKVSVEGHTHNYINSLGDKDASDLSSTYPNGLSVAGIYNNGYPFTFGSTITAKGNGGYFQIAGQWNAAVSSLTDPDHPTEMYIRGRRDSYDVWTTWTRVLTNRNWSSVITLPTKASWNYDDRYSFSHQPYSAAFAFNIEHNSNYVTFDGDQLAGAPNTNWFNGFVSTHNNYLSSYLINQHRTSDWYVGYSERKTAPTWYKLIHSGNYTNYTVTKTGGGASGKWDINISGNASTATIATQDSDGNQINTTYVKKRQAGYSYNNLGAGYSGGTNVGYWRITIPKEDVWCMMQMTCSLIQSYSSGYHAKVIIYGYCYSGANWTAFNARVIGYNSEITVHGADRKYIYIKTNNSWETLSVDKIIFADKITNYDVSAITIDWVSSLPSTHQDATMYQDIHSGNIGSQSVNYATSAGSAGSAGSATIATQDSDGNQINTTYLKRSGGTMTGSPYINMPSSAATISDSQPFGITYGRIQGYSNIVIAADTDRSTSEYAVITSGYDVANATKANGLAIGYNTLTWKNNTVWHAGNDGSGSGLDADTVDNVHLDSILTYKNSIGNRTQNNHDFHSALNKGVYEVTWGGYVANHPSDWEDGSNHFGQMLHFGGDNHGYILLDRGTQNMYFKNIGGTTSYGEWYKVAHSGNSSVSKSGDTLTVKINGTTQSLTNTNTWRGITDTYNITSASNSVSLSQLGAYHMYDNLTFGTRWYCNGDGTNGWCLVAEFNTSGAYINKPIIFEFLGRGMTLTHITVQFANSDAADPDLQIFGTNYASSFRMYKVSANKWQLYGQDPSTVWQQLELVRVYGLTSIVTIKMERVASIPDGTIPITTYVGNVGYATKAAQDGNGNDINTTYLKRSGGSMTNTNVVTNLNADLLDGRHLNSNRAKPWGTIPWIGSDGVIELGNYIDFHHDNTTGSDYSTRLHTTGNHSNSVNLPSASGTLALTSDNVASATKLQTARTLWGQSFDGTGNVNGKITLIYNADEQLRISASYTSGVNGYAHAIDVINPSLSSGEAYLYQIGRASSNSNSAYFGYVYGGDSGTSYATIGLHSHDRILNVTASDMVGIGTTTPSYKLDVNGTLHASGATTLSSTLSVSGNTTIGGTLGVTGTTTLKSTTTITANTYISGETYFSAVDAFRLNYGSYGVIHRNDGGSYWILLTNKDNLNGGFNNLRPFHIDFSTGTVYMDNNAIIDNLAFTQCNISMGGRVNATWGYDLNTNDYYGLYFKSKNSSSTGILFNDDGNVGINTVSPSYKLDVNGTLRVSDTITATSLAADYTDTWSDGTHTHPWYGYDHRYANTGVYSTVISDYFGMTLKTKSGNISITNGGNVGIGTFAPLRKLHVIGEAIFGESGYVASQGTGSAYSGTWVGQGFMELSAPNPYIDFHANKSTADFTSRLIQWSDEVRLLYVSSDASYNGYILTCEGNHHNPVILGIFDLKRSGQGSTIWTLDNICGPCVFTLANNWGSDTTFDSHTYWTIPANLLRVEINGTLGANYTTKTTVKAASCIGTVMTRWINNQPVVSNRSHEHVEGCSVECLCTDKAPGTNLYYDSNSPGKYIYITGARPYGYDDGTNGLSMDQFRRTGNLSYLRVRFVVYGWLE